MTSYALYLHIPFCRQRCSYCDFNTYTTVNELQEPYVAALCQEIRQVAAMSAAAGQPRPQVHTIFFGGGTPSLLRARQVAAILSTVGESFALAADAEITLEANPGTVAVDYLAALRRLGVTRLSYGVQSANQGELSLLGREHDFETAVDALAMARAAGFDNVNLDFIYGLPGQTVSDWERSLRAALALQPEHLSLYCLTVESGTPMDHWVFSGRVAKPDPDVAADQYELAWHMLGEAGYVHYEISNWARPGRECRHNLVYWRNQPYLGLGAGAHGSANGYRYHVVRQPRVYIRRMQDEGRGPFPISSAAAAFHAVQPPEAMSDTIITQLRLLGEGLNLEQFHNAFGSEFDAIYGDTAAKLEGWGLLRRENGRLLLSDKGRFLSNQVFHRFV